MASWVLPGEVDDRQILDASRDADHQALDLLYRRYGPAIRSFCRSRLRGDDAAAEDACQETVLKAYGALPRFQRGARIWPWLTTIAAHVCVDLQRERARETVWAEPPVTEATPSPDPDDVATCWLRASLVRQALTRLSPRQRAYVSLKDLEGQSYEQIAEADNTTVPAVRTTLYRGRVALRGAVEAVARERREWPLPAFVPALWWRARGRVSQLWAEARECAAAVGTRLEPSVALNTIIGSSALVQASVAVLMITGIGGPLATSVGAQDVRPALTARAAGTSAGSDLFLNRQPGFSGEPDAHGSQARVPRSSATPGERVNVAIDGQFEKHSSEGGTQYQLHPTSGTLDLDGYTDDPGGDIGFKTALKGYCPPPEQRDAFWEANCLAFGALGGE